MVIQWQKKDVVEVDDTDSIAIPQDNTDDEIDPAVDLDDDALDLSIGNRAPQTQKSTTGKKRKRPKQKDKTTTKATKAKLHKPPMTLVEKPKRTSMVIGVDYGTTYSGLSYKQNIESTDSRPQSIQTWPDAGSDLVKTPSVIAYARENQNCRSEIEELSRDVVGYEVKAGMNAYGWLKLLLAEDVSPTDFDDPCLRTAIGKGTLRLPEGKSVIECNADLLRNILRIAKEELANSLGQEILDTTPIEYWITVPAIWGDKPQARTRAVLELAGFNSRKMDKISFVSEPEAAAVAALKYYALQNESPIKTNMRIILADVGGGTIDVEAMTIESMDPLKLQIRGVGQGGICGSSAIDRLFLTWIKHNFGAFYDDIPDEKKGPGSHLLTSFEAEKRNFKGELKKSHRVSFPELGRLLEARKVSSKLFDEEDRQLLFKGSDMAAFFKQTVDQTCALIKQKSARAHPDAVILVGGLSRSVYLRDIVRDFCKEKFGERVKLILPENAWSAISEGAVWYGMDRTTVISRVSRRWYCMVQERAFSEGIDSEDRAVMHPKLGKRVRGALTVLLQKGERIMEKQKKRISGEILISDTSAESLVYGYKIICSDADGEPKFEDDPGCYSIGELGIDLTNVVRLWGKKGGYWAANFDASKTPVPRDLNVTLSGGYGAGVMHIQANVQRKRVGELMLDYSVTKDH